MSRFLPLLAAAIAALTPFAGQAYPIDGYEETGIRRVEGARRAQEGLALGARQLPGALLTTAQVDVRLLGHRELDLPAPEPAFSAEVRALLGAEAAGYAVALLDLTDPDAPLYAEHRGDYRQNVGSVGKVLAALGYFQALADAWPEDLERRKSILRNTVIIADDFARTDHHTLRFFDVETNTLTRGILDVGGRGSPWEYLDWMLSASSNSAASLVMRDAMLLRQYGRDYPVPEPRIDAFFDETPGADLTRLFQRTFWEPVSRNGLDLGQVRQGSFFTAQGKRIVNGGGNSYASARSLAEFMLRLEQGRLVDTWSSRELKRLLYLTERRIRYASSPALDEAAVYFKSGSLYKCNPEKGFECAKYLGNVFNYMSSVVIVEQEIEGVKLHYVAVVISNVLRRNSAVEHQKLGTEIHRLIGRRHGLD